MSSSAKRFERPSGRSYNRAMHILLRGRRRVIGVVAGLATCLALAIALAAEPPRPPSPALAHPAGSSAAFAGVVTDLLTDRPVPGARIWLRGVGEAVEAGPDGAYLLPASAGRWEVCAAAPGYVPMSYVLQAVRTGQQATLDFRLVKEHLTLAEETRLREGLGIAQAWPADGKEPEPIEPGVRAAAVPTTIRVLMPDDTVVEMDLEEYLKGVVPHEIGVANVPMEALKAQAIAARSYAATANNHADKGANVCTSPACCQVWKPIHFGPTDQAVEATRGVVATYQGSIIHAFYFGHCDGRTRNSEDIDWSVVPYCRSVQCSCGFDFLYGHGVGMCQEGAIEMARRGARADDILRHYYTGISVSGLPGATPTPTSPPSATSTPIPTVTMSYRLVPGWNLMSLPVRLSEPGVSRVLAPITGAYDLVEVWDCWDAITPWMVYDATAPVQYSDLSQLGPQHGIWIRVRQPVTLTVTGPRLTTVFDLPLNVGPNLVGYPCNTARPVAVALASIAGKYARVYSYDASRPRDPWTLYDTTRPSFLNTLTEMTPGRAYWIWTYEPCTWRIPP